MYKRSGCFRSAFLIQMKALILILLCPFGVWAQHIQIDDTDPLQPVIRVANIYEGKVPSDSVEKNVESLLTFTQVMDGKPAPVSVSGKYTHKDGDLIFKPLTDLGAGLEFEIRYQSEVQKYQTPKPLNANEPLAYVENVFPASTEVPRNILFFHVQFSNTMLHDINGYENVRILDPQGKEIPTVWRQRSYWLEDQKVLVLMVHPGKVKRGIDMEIPFQIGETYTLEVLPEMKDVYGRAMAKPYVHQFTIIAEDYEMPKVLFDLIKKPKANSRKTLIIPFSEGMDHSSIVDGVKIYTRDGKQINGVYTWNETDQTFGFVPNEKWVSGEYQIVFEKKVCDFANNRLNRPFEMKSREEVLKDQELVTYSFEL